MTKQPAPVPALQIYATYTIVNGSCYISLVNLHKISVIKFPFVLTKMVVEDCVCAFIKLWLCNYRLWNVSESAHYMDVSLVLVISGL